MLYFFSKLLNIFPQGLYIVLLLIFPLVVCFATQVAIAKVLLKLNLSGKKVALVSFVTTLVFYLFFFFVISLFSLPTGMVWLQNAISQTMIYMAELLSSFFGENIFSALAIYFIFPWPFAYLAVYGVLRKMKSQSVTPFKVSYAIQAFMLSVLGGLIAVCIGIATIWGTFALENLCQWHIIDSFHQFHAHIKNVCVREDLSECPRNESELRAFRPQAYDRLTQCTYPQYRFDESTGLYEWRVPYRGGVLRGARDTDYTYPSEEEWGW